MAFVWFDSDLHGLPIVWTAIEAICEVDLDQELLSSDFEVLTVGLEGYGYFDNLFFSRNRTNEIINGSDVMNLLIEPSSGEFEIPVFASVKEDCTIVAAHIVPHENITGDDNDYCQLKLVNKTQNKLLGTKTFKLGNDANAFEMTTMGGIMEEIMDYGDVVAFEKEDFGSGISLPLLLLVIEWNLA
ncbi:hypothetical protein [Dehalobacterium formicoaceticum]|uniref:hypothetical protein n=1 Tax=Dehalobacterium formicoaceticum TaxID=51515 RepID=UPI000B7DB842|nr:hypothetical protein [Dehalobacterium formicoaceticum]